MLARGRTCILNLTPHDINFCGGETIPSDGSARLKEKIVKVEEIEGIPLVHVEYEEPDVTIKSETIDEMEKRPCEHIHVVVSGMFDKEAALKLQDTLFDKFAIDAESILAPYTGTDPRFAPERERGMIKCVKALRKII